MQALKELPEIKDKNLLVGVNTADDAGVYKLTNELALVYTVDMLNPLVDDPYTFGMIAAANCISDIYAMGGKPKLALNIVGFPCKGEAKILGKMLKGGQTKAKQAGVTMCGGHTFNSEEIKYGLSVIGYIHPKKIITNANAKAGDVIVLTKPIGVGTIVHAYINGRLEKSALKPVIKSMTFLNRDASNAMQGIAHSATDITGYGLAGHLVEMAQGSKTGIEISLSKIPIHKGALEILKSGIVEPGISMNMGSFGNLVIKDGVDATLSMLIFGSETSGGLAIVMPPNKLETFRKKYKLSAPVIGRVTKENKGQLKITP
jgi:selenide,water dikinase